MERIEFICTTYLKKRRVSIELKKNSNVYKVSIKKYHNRRAFGGVEDSLPFKNITRTLSKKEWDNFTSKINAYFFWTMDSNMNDGYCADGGLLFLEGNNPNIKCPKVKPYHCVFGSCVDSLKGYKYIELCDLLLDLEKEK